MAPRMCLPKKDSIKMLLTRAFGNTLGHLACAAKEKASKTKMAFILSFCFKFGFINNQSMFWINM